MAVITSQSHEEDVCVVSLGPGIVISDVTRAEAEAIVAAHERVTARTASRG